MTTISVATTGEVPVANDTIFKIDLFKMNFKAENILYKSPYKFIVTFTNGEVKKFDLMPYLKYSVMGSSKMNLSVEKRLSKMVQLYGMKKLILTPTGYI